MNKKRMMKIGSTGLVCLLTLGSAGYLFSAKPPASESTLFDFGPATQVALDEAKHEQSVQAKVVAGNLSGALDELNTMEGLYGETPFIVEYRFKAQPSQSSNAALDQYLRVMRGHAPNPGNTDFYGQALELAHTQGSPELTEIAEFVLSNMRQPSVLSDALNLTRTPPTEAKKRAYAFAYCAWDQEDILDQVRQMRIARSYSPDDTLLKVHLALSLDRVSPLAGLELERNQLIREAYVSAAGNSALRSTIEQAATLFRINL
jgi:hypothetical protein